MPWKISLCVRILRQLLKNKCWQLLCPWKNNCFFCEDHYHSLTTCPGRTPVCGECGKKDYLARVCLSKTSAHGGKASTATVFNFSHPSVFATVAGIIFPQSLRQAETSVTIKGCNLTTLVDSCSDDRDFKLRVHRSDTDVSLAQISLHFTRLVEWIEGSDSSAALREINESPIFHWGCPERLCLL